MQRAMPLDGLQAQGLTSKHIFMPSWNDWMDACEPQMTCPATDNGQRTWRFVHGVRSRQLDCSVQQEPSSKHTAYSWLSECMQGWCSKHRMSWLRRHASEAS